MNANQGFDHALAPKMAGMIVAALVGVFVLHKLGFRFVASAGVKA